MPSFAYTLRDAAGRAQEGVLAAPDAAAASAALRSGGNLLLRLEPTTEHGGTGSKPARTFFTLERRPRSAAVEVALKQMAVMLRSGLTLLESLRAAADQSTSKPLKRVWRDIADRVQEGQTLTQAMSHHRWLGRMVIQLVEIGERTGHLDEVLDRAGEALERKRLIKNQVFAAMLYPSVVFLAALGVTAFVLTFAVPKITKFLQAFGRPLPAMTQVLVDLSDFLLTRWPTLIGVLLFVVALFVVAYRTPTGRLAIDSTLLRVPLLGYIFRTSATASFSRALALMLASGVTIVESLRTCQQLHRNRRLATLVAGAREAVLAGSPLGPALDRPRCFMPMLPSMVSIGERSGNLDQTLTSCAEFHEQRLAALIRTLSGVVEIVVVLVVGGIVGYVYIAFMMALYGTAM